MALDKASGTVMHFLIRFLKSNVIYKSAKDLDDLIPLYLYAVKTGNLKLAKWVLGLLRDAVDEDLEQVVNGRDDMGVNAVFAAIQSGSMMMLKWVLSHKSFSVNIVFDKSANGLSALHYAMRTGKIDIFKEVFSIYSQHEKGDIKALMLNTRDNEGNTPFMRAVKEGRTDLGKLHIWIMNQFGGDVESKMRMLFGQNKNKEIPLIASYQSSPSLSTAHDHIWEYFTMIKVVNEGNADLAERALVFLARFESGRPTMRLIVEATQKNMVVLNRVLNLRDSSIDDVLYTLTKYVGSPSSNRERDENDGVFSRMGTLEWFLTKVVPDNHPCLFSQSTHSGNTAFLHLVRNGKIKMAEILLAKITDDETKLQLLNAKTLPGRHGGESAMDWAKKRNIKSVVDWLGEQITDLQ